jgi:hypothetical protein
LGPAVFVLTENALAKTHPVLALFAMRRRTSDFFSRPWDRHLNRVQVFDEPSIWASASAMVSETLAMIGAFPSETYARYLLFYRHRFSGRFEPKQFP